MQLAEPLLITRNKIRFRSLVNRRIFSLVFNAGRFAVLEMGESSFRLFVNRILYIGFDADEVKKVILQEVCDVW